MPWAPIGPHSSRRRRARRRAEGIEDCGRTESRDDRDGAGTDGRNYPLVDREVDVEEGHRQSPGHGQAQDRREDRREYGEQKELQHESPDDLALARAQHLCDERIGTALLPSGRQTSDQHKQAVADGESADQRGRQRELAECLRDLIEGFTDSDEADFGERRGEASLDSVLTTGSGLNCAKQCRGIGFEGTRREGDEEVDPRLPRIVSEVGNFRGDRYRRRYRR